MKFERLTPPGWQLPDLVAFNQRVHEWVDPWWAHWWVRWISWAIAGLFVLFAAMWIYFAAGLPSAQTLLAYQPPLPTNIRGYDGDPIQTFARERRVDLTYDEIPPLIVHAFTSAEDKDFFHHHGIDYSGTIKAVFNYTTHLGRGGRVPGGSTITQQVAKYLLRDSSYNVGRKAREAILAFRLEDTLTKQQILELYLNSIFLGRNAYGVQAAARAYFDKDVDELTLPEAAYLAILPKAPSNYDPVRATQKALDRRNYVLREMYKNGYITEDQWHSAAATPLGTIRYGSNEKFRQQGGYFMEEVRRELVKLYGEDAKDGSNSLYAGGLWVRTSMDPKMQDPAAQALRDGLVKFGGNAGWKDLGIKVNLSKDWAAQLDQAQVGTGYADWLKAVVLSKNGGAATVGFTNGSTGTLPASGASMPVRGAGGSAFDALQPGMVVIVKQTAPSNYQLKSAPAISGGMIVEEVHTGRVLAMQGGFDVVGSAYNRAVQALRQPGSAFKPIVYVTALQNGFTPATIELDAPYCIDQGPGLPQKCFVNFDHRSAGPHTLRWGLEQSRNLMTVRAAANIGMPKITDTARKLGVGDYPNYLSIALGDDHRLRPGPRRQSHLPDRQPLRADGQLQCRRLGRRPDAAAAEPHSAARRRHGRVPDGPRDGRRDHPRHRDRPPRPQPSAVRQDRHHQRPDQRVVRRRDARHRGRRLRRLRQSQADGLLGPGRPDLRADLEGMGADRAQGRAQGPVRRPARHPLDPDRQGERQAGGRGVPDQRQ
jgi:penicillin-binding protein 1A